MRYFAVAPIKLGMVAFRDPQPKIALVAKVTYRVTGGAAPTLALENRPLPLVMEAVGPSGALQHGEDFVPRKRFVDVTVVGNVQLSDGATGKLTGLAAGGIRKRLRVVTPVGSEGLQGRTDAFRTSPQAHSRSGEGFSLALDNATLVDEAGARSTLGPRALNVAAGSAPWNAIEHAWADSFLTLQPDETGQSFQSAPWDQQAREGMGPGSVITLEQLFNHGTTTLTLPHVVPWLLLLPAQLRVDLAPSIQRLRPRLDTLHFDTAERTLEVVHRSEIAIGSFEEVPDVMVGLGPVDWFPNAAAAFDVVRSSAPELVATRRNASPTVPRPASLELSRKRAMPGTGGRRRAGTEIMPRVALPAAAQAALQHATQQQAGAAATDRMREADAPSRDTSVMDPPASAYPPIVVPAGQRTLAPKSRPTTSPSSLLLGPWRVTLERGHADRWVGQAVHESTGRSGIAHLEPVQLASAQRGGLLDRAELFASVSHASIRSIVDRGVLPDGRSFVIEACPKGQSMAATVAGQRPPWREALRWVSALLDGVTSFHAAGLALTVIDPSQLFLEDSRCVMGWAPLLRQFGDASEPGDPGYVVAPFAAPEVAAGEYAQVFAATDVWSIGALSYWLLAGQAPHGNANTQRTLVAAATRPAPSLAASGAPVPRPIVEAVDRALAREQGARFADAAAFAEALRGGRTLDLPTNDDGKSGTG